MFVGTPGLSTWYVIGYPPPPGRFAFSGAVMVCDEKSSGIEQRVLEHEEAVEPSPVVADLDRRARQNLLLYADAELPVGRPHAPPVQGGRIDLRLAGGAPETGRRPRTALAVRRRVHQAAIRQEVAVGVGPCPVDRGLEVRTDSPVATVHRGIRNRVVLLIVRALEILAEVHADRRLPFAGDVPRHAHARRDVVEGVDAVRRREGDGRRVVGSGDRRAVVVGREETPRAVVPDARPAA